MQIYVSPDATLTKMDQLASSHDAPVVTWKESIEKTLRGNQHFSELSGMQ